jgi:hypothetical protein
MSEEIRVGEAAVDEQPGSIEHQASVNSAEVQHEPGAAAVGIPVYGNPVVGVPVVGAINNEPDAEEDPQAAAGGACSCQSCYDGLSTYFCCGENVVMPGLSCTAGAVGASSLTSLSSGIVAAGTCIGICCVSPMAFWAPYGAYRAVKAGKDKLCPPPAEGMAAQGNGGAYQALNEEQPGLQHPGPGAQVMRN